MKCCYSWPSKLIVLLALALAASACVGPAYYAQAIAGHYSLMRSRIPVSKLLADPETDPQLAAHLAQSENLLVFAREHLDLDAGNNFSQVVLTRRTAVTWNVVAAPEFSLEPRRWCFPVSGCVPYRGYFKQQAAEKFASRMQDRGLDVMISPAVAYSTLGWFDDPLLDTMFQYSTEQLAGIMFHELAHDKLYVKGDTEFSEAFANFVELAGVRLWLSTSGDLEKSKDWERRQLAALQFNRMFFEARQSLQALYQANASNETKRREKSLLFESLQEAYRAMVSDQWNGISYFAAWMSGELNNAHLALINSYEGGNCAFAALYEQAGRKFQRFYALARKKAELDPVQRKEWLGHACDEFASPPEL